MTNIKTKGNIQQKAKNILNVNHAEVVNNNNNYYTSDAESVRRIYNKTLTREIILVLKADPGPQGFPQELSFTDKDNWENELQHLIDAQSYIGESFVWLIGEELRRLFVIGNNKQDNDKIKIDKYIKRCVRIYRNSLQLINYLFISKLWDEEIKHRNLDIDKTQIRKFFETEILLKLEDLRGLFQGLIEIFKSNPQLGFPLDAADLGDINEYLKSDSKFNKACVELEKINELDQGNEMYSVVQCERAEISLTTIISTLSFLTKYQLASMKKIEYVESRNTAPRYIKDFNILKLPPFESGKNRIPESDARKNLLRFLKYDEKPQLTYSVYFYNQNRSINLFPFLIDYNALTNEADFQLYFYEYRIKESGLCYYSINKEIQNRIDYMATTPNKDEIKDEKLVNLQQINIRLDLVVKQFEEAMNTILKTKFSFRPKVSTMNTDSINF